LHIKSDSIVGAATGYGYLRSAKLKAEENNYWSSVPASAEKFEIQSIKLLTIRDPRVEFPDVLAHLKYFL
jgi:hypothetical protein